MKISTQLVTIVALMLVGPALADPIHEASLDGDIDEVRNQLNADVNVDIKSLEGLTPLHYATMEGHNKIVEFLIERGANVNETNNGKGATPLDYAHWFEQTDVIETLNAHNAQRGYVKGGKGIGQSSTIHEASLDGDIDEVRNQLDAGVDPNSKSSKGSSPLFYAVYGGHKEIIELLIARGADINAANLNGGNVLDLALYYNDQEMVKLLEANGAETADMVGGKEDGGQLRITNLSDDIVIVEFEYGILQTASSINGPWEDIVESSPVTWTVNQLSKFARLRFDKEGK